MFERLPRAWIGVVALATAVACSGSGKPTARPSASSPSPSVSVLPTEFTPSASPSATASTAAPAAGGGGGGGSATTPAVTRPARIIVGMHAPITGYGPVQTGTAGYTLYWRWLNDRGGINGTKVEADLVDDTGTSAGGAAACRNLAGRGVVLMLGLSLPDAVTGAAQCANERGIPYPTTTVFPGNLLNTLKTVYVWTAGTAHDRVSADYAVHKLGKKKFATIRTNSPNFEPGHAAFKARVQQLGGQIVLDRTVSRGEPNWAGLLTEIKSSGAEAVELVVDAIAAINLFVQAAFDPYFAKIWFLGTGFAINEVATFYNVARSNWSGSGPVTGGLRLTWPFDAFDSGAIQNELRAAWAKYKMKGAPQDYHWLAWATNRFIHRLLLHADPNLTKAGVLKALPTFHWTGEGIVAPIDFRKGKIGAQAVTLLEAREGKFVQIAGFVTGF